VSPDETVLNSVWCLDPYVEPDKGLGIMILYLYDLPFEYEIKKGDESPFFKNQSELISLNAVAVNVCNTEDAVVLIYAGLYCAGNWTATSREWILRHSVTSLESNLWVER